MATLLKKHGKFLTGHSYATGFGYKFSWSKDQSKARRFMDDGSDGLESLQQLTRTSAQKVPNTKRELKQLGRNAIRRKEWDKLKFA